MQNNEIVVSGMFSVKMLVAKILGALLLIVLLNELLLLAADNLLIANQEKRLEEHSQQLSYELASQSPGRWLAQIQDYERQYGYEVLLSQTPTADRAPLSLPAELSNHIVSSEELTGSMEAELPADMVMASEALLLDDELALTDMVLGWNQPIAGTGWDLTLNADGEPSLLLAWLVGGFSLLLFVLALYWLLRPIRLEAQRIQAAVPGDESGGELSTAVEQELLRMREQLQVSHDEWRDLLHGVAHELRSPLARISFALSEWQESVNADDRDEFKGMVDKAIDDLDGLVSEVLRYSRLELQRGRGMLIETVSIDELVASSCERIKPLYPEINILIDGYSPFPVEVNQAQMQRAVINLLRNAARYSEKQLAVDWQRNESGWSLIIDDDGPGIPPGKRARIFEPFTRLDPSRSRDSGGNGLGLAIVKSIVDNHNGEIAVDNSPLGGARFILSLPDADNNKAAG